MDEETKEDMVFGICAFILCILIIILLSLGSAKLSIGSINDGYLFFGSGIVSGIGIIILYWYYFRVVLKNRKNP